MLPSTLTWPWHKVVQQVDLCNHIMARKWLDKWIQAKSLKEAKIWQSRNCNCFSLTWKELRSTGSHWYLMDAEWTALPEVYLGCMLRCTMRCHLIVSGLCNILDLSLRMRPCTEAMLKWFLHWNMDKGSLSLRCMEPVQHLTCNCGKMATFLKNGVLGIQCTNQAGKEWGLPYGDGERTQQHLNSQ